MRRAGRHTPFVLTLALALALAWVGTAAAQGILNTKHNLSSNSGATNATGDIKTSGTNEVCVFCHTPHGSDSSVSAPLWNRRVNTSGYTMYNAVNSATYDATTDSQPTGVSLACLSCHDGTIAFDALRNLPGSGGWNNAPGAAGVTNWAFNGTTDKKMPARTDTTGITNLSQDLSDDHPISMVYSTAKSPSSTNGTDDHATGFQATPLNGVRLYNGKVQCASCHDPHRSDTATFLRVANTGSTLCRSCHKKDG